MKRFDCTYLLLIFLLCGLVPPQSYAADVSVTATVDATTASLEDYILLSVSVDGVRTEPTLSGLDDFRVSSRGSSSQMRYANGQMSSSKEFTYLLQPLKAGTFTIGPFLVVHKKTTYASDTITLIITKRSASIAETDTTTEREVFVIAEVDNLNPYVHEQIIYTFKFYRRVEIGEARLSVVPDFEGFLSKSLGKEREYRRVINGHTYMVTELSRALFPVKSGVLTIAASTLDCELIIRERRGRGGRLNDSFFDNSFFSFNSRRKSKTLRTEPLTVMVHQLPTTGRPDGFGQLVGEFKLSGKLSTTSVPAGDSATLTLRLHGDGNMRGMKTIDLPLLQNVKVYDDKPVFKADQSSKRAGGTLIIKKALVPMEQGGLTIPLVEVSYFNPIEKKYKTTRAGPFTISVLPPRESETLQAVVPGRATVSKEDVEVLGNDVLPIQTGFDVLERERDPRLRAVHFVLLIAPVCLYALFIFVYFARARRYSDSERVRARSAWPRFSKNIPVLRASINDSNNDFCGEAARALRDFIGDRLGVTGSAFTPLEIAQFLTDAGVHEQLVSRIKHVLEQCDIGCYGVAVNDASARQELLKELIQTARELHRSR
jgi:hypothetical protein